MFGVAVISTQKFPSHRRLSGNVQMKGFAIAMRVKGLKLTKIDQVDVQSRSHFKHHALGSGKVSWGRHMSLIGARQPYRHPVDS